MANDIGRAMARLSHRDIRTRRRAVRTLFEHDDPSTLEAFEVLLDDEDPWFVSKALDAYRQWAPLTGPEDVATLLQHPNLDVRRAGANLLATLGRGGRALALQALNDDDGVVQKKASQALLRVAQEGDVDTLASHPSPTIRGLAMQHGDLSATLVLKGLEDEAETVRGHALYATLQRNLDISIEALEPFFAADIHAVSILTWASENQPDRLSSFASRMKPSHVKALSDHLREHVSTSEDPLINGLTEANVLEPVARWVLRQGAEEDALRWSLIENRDLALIERSKLLERLIGRAGEPEVQAKVRSFMEQTTDELLKVACENLSTAASEL
jgi:hypothetical protein